VNDAFLVARGERIGEGRADLQHLPEGQPAARDHLIQALPLDPLHRQEADVAVLLDRVDSDDVGVGKGGDRFGLALEAGEAVVPRPRSGRP